MLSIVNGDRLHQSQAVAYYIPCLTHKYRCRHSTNAMPPGCENKSNGIPVPFLTELSHV